MTECKHIYGFEDVQDYDDLATLIDDGTFLADRDGDVLFKYCPLCGVELKPEVEK